MKRINTVEELKELSADDYGCECLILLNGGCFSRKTVYYFEEGWTVQNHIDDSESHAATWEELEKISNVPKALKLGALVRDEE